MYGPATALTEGMRLSSEVVSSNSFEFPYIKMFNQI